MLLSEHVLKGFFFFFFLGGGGGCFQFAIKALLKSMIITQLRKEGLHYYQIILTIVVNAAHKA